MPWSVMPCRWSRPASAPERRRVPLPGVTAADVRTTGALTALIAALPSLLEGEGERMAADGGDPHCARVLDVTYW
ncbi:hypothetical protein [Streptomyces sp. NBC_01235]|uniref:hypothetical protein n=1 Tax=Streptomyces sp. NBC_01235 TaxID=2903788 RepID=UPI002E11EC43|nr:hypothetical protein OG289_17200 [Streptomyces sp. NBC_01235]